MKKSIVTKLMIFTSALILSVLLCQAVFNFFFSKSYFIEHKRTAVETLFLSIRENYSDDPDSIYAVTRKAENDNIDILIFSEKGFIYSSRNIDLLRWGLFAGGGMSFEPSPQARVREGRRGILPTITLNGRFDFGGETRYVTIETPVEAIEAGVRLLSKVNLFISVIALVIGLACALWFARNFSRPIREIQAVAQNVAALKFDARADENAGTTELSELSASINTMAEKLKTLIVDLQKKNERLQGDIEQQQRLDKMRREFVANVSHELKTPLCLLLMYSENLKNNVDSIDKDFYCDTIMEEVKNLDDMAKSLLDLSSIENGLSGLSLTPVDFSALCLDVVSRTEPMFRQIRVDTEIQPGICVAGDSHYLEQALRNYITNAISHTAAGGRISVCLARAGEEQVMLSVFNEGKPIDPDDAAQLWESFYKTDKARVREDENHAGLGLYIVKTIVAAHNGAYGLINHDDGVTFWFSLPAAPLPQIS
jgi:signal transduction histidine kinase